MSGHLGPTPHLPNFDFEGCNYPALPLSSSRSSDSGWETDSSSPHAYPALPSSSSHEGDWETDSDADFYRDDFDSYTQLASPSPLKVQRGGLFLEEKTKRWEEGLKSKDRQRREEREETPIYETFTRQRANTVLDFTPEKHWAVKNWEELAEDTSLPRRHAAGTDNHDWLVESPETRTQIRTAYTGLPDRHYSAVNLEKLAEDTPLPRRYTAGNDCAYLAQTENKSLNNYPPPTKPARRKLAAGDEMDQGDIPTLLNRLASDEDAMRKMAVFKLQSSINDPAFADMFISSGGLTILRRLIMSTGGNTLAYSLQSLTRLLEVDMGWEIFESAGAGELVERIVELIVQQPLVNILRGAMSILVAIVSHPQSSEGKILPGAYNYGFHALKPSVAVFPTFFEMVVSQLESADHALCANSLSLLNALIRDSITYDEAKVQDSAGKGTGTVEEWQKFIKRLQELGVVTAVYAMMQGSALQDLAVPLLEYQALSKVLLKKWKQMPLELEKPDHRRAVKSLHLASAPDKKVPLAATMDGSTNGHSGSKKGSQKESHNPNKWRRLGFETESPAKEFESTGYLGMIDLADFVKKHEDTFQKLLLEQSLRPAKMRCPIARASLAVTVILYEHFDVDTSDVEDAKAYLVLDGMRNYDKVFRPLLLKWSELHTAGLLAFIRLWKGTGARLCSDDFDKVGALTRILVDTVVGKATRQKDIADVVEEFSEWELPELRTLQMQLLELEFEEDWGPYLKNIRTDLKQDALQFVKEQRIRCLLEGSWFPCNTSEIDGPWLFARLSSNRRYLHYSTFADRNPDNPTTAELNEKLDLGTVTSVVSNVTARQMEKIPRNSSTTTLKTPNAAEAPKTNTKITIYGTGGSTDSKSQASDNDDVAMLILYPPTPALASEWLDGMLMLLNQAPITADTTKMVEFINEYSMRLRLLSVDLGMPPREGGGVVPSRRGLDEDYWYDMQGQTYGDVVGGKYT
ncbi:ELMO/CED-12 family-domain-containing protein [Calycina marina]|uniref:ELMO/CED-12 family-domain-containing protein n=1 Tax=Calycina marina TaxID=1763456 RepID=A0A9P7YYA0_9HELO|nr:ELMO/CED-12 family-domain-containing protein [Calycina marina]